LVLDWLPTAIRQCSTQHELLANETLFRQGDKASAIYEIEQGQLRLIRHSIDGHSVILHTARAGELFAEAALFADTYHCDAVTTAASRVRAYPKQKLLAGLRRNSALAEKYMATLAHQVHLLRSRLEERNIRSARERILHHLLLSADPESGIVRVHGTLMDFAAEMGLTHEALYRTLAALEREGVIVRTPSAIIVMRTKQP
jgi:CRP/FNR family transcriptional regulator, dissimilatory nitrate respiration regulator